jgi:hypothetical protein
VPGGLSQLYPAAITFLPELACVTETADKPVPAEDGMDRLTEMEAFAMVVDQGGFTDAARKLGISKSAVSKHISSL